VGVEEYDVDAGDDETMHKYGN